MPWDGKKANRHKLVRFVRCQKRILRRARYPLRGSKYSNHLYTDHQRVVLLALRQHFKKSYRGFCEILEVCDSLLEEARAHPPPVPEGGEGEGVYLAVEARKQIIVAAKFRRGSSGDSPDFISTLKNVRPAALLVKLVVADKGYDSERNLEYAREIPGARTAMPVRVASCPKIKLRGKGRRQRKCFDQRGYDGHRRRLRGCSLWRRGGWNRRCWFGTRASSTRSWYSGRFNTTRGDWSAYLCSPSRISTRQW